MKENPFEAEEEWKFSSLLSSVEGKKVKIEKQRGWLRNGRNSLIIIWDVFRARKTENGAEKWNRRIKAIEPSSVLENSCLHDLKWKQVYEVYGSIKFQMFP